MSRANFTEKQKREIRARSAGRCTECGDPGVDVDHIHACGLGGARDLDNGRLLCVRCHKSKTDSDKAAIAKADRCRKKLVEGWKPKWKRPISSRGFDKRLTRGFDGKVRER